jgi:rubrerythrin
MSRIPRLHEHLKTGATAEALAAARFRAYARRAERADLPHLAARWRELAAAKDELAIVQLEAAGQVRGPAEDLEATIAEERYENEVLYPKLIADAGEPATVFREVMAAQERHLAELERLRQALGASQGDVGATVEAGVAAGVLEGHERV